MSEIMIAMLNWHWILKLNNRYTFNNKKFVALGICEI